MRYFIDTEFIEDGHIIDLISIGIVCEDGAEFYVENADCELSRAGDFVRSEVIPHLSQDNPGIPHYEIGERVQAFCSAVDKPEFWGYYADYDWVAFCQLFGRMVDLPRGWPKYCRDLKQWCDQLGNPKLPDPQRLEHHALYDARHNRDIWRYLWNVAVSQSTNW